MCPNCGSCFSKKSNLYNHLHRGKGCPKKNDGEVFTPSPVIKTKVKKEKIKFAEVVNDEVGESDEELSDLVIDDRNNSEIMDNADTLTEEEDEEEEQVEESYVQVQESSVRSNGQNRLEFLRANRDLLQPRVWSDQSSPSPPPTAGSTSSSGSGRSAPTQLNNLHLLADIAMAHTQYSSDNSSSDQETERQEPANQRTVLETSTNQRTVLGPSTNQRKVLESSTNQSQAHTQSQTVRTIRIPNPATSPGALPLNLSQPKKSVKTLSPGYRDIQPHTPAAKQQLVTTAGTKLVTAAGSSPGVYQMIPVQTSSTPVMMIQSNGGSTGHGAVIQLPNKVLTTSNLFGANLGRIV